MMVRAEDLARMLADNAEVVASMLLPAGKRQGSEWCAGSISGEAGDSLKVRLQGSKAGRWKDFAADDRGGDLLDLWAAVRGMSVSEAMADVRQYLGIRDPQFHGTATKVAKPLPKPKGCKAAGNAVTDWLVDTRMIKPEVVKAYRVAERDGMAVFPYLSPGGDLLFVKYREAREHGPTKPEKAKIRSEAGGTPSLFGWQAIPDTAREVVICEGETDALAWATYGFPALSPPNGANGHTWVEVEFDHLQRFDKIYLSYDMDAVGRKGLGGLIARLGQDRCFVVELPRKDANECLMKGEPLPVIEGCLRHAQTRDPDELRAATEFTDAVIREFYPPGDVEPGIALPWRKLDGVKLRPGEVSLLPGINGHGKSQMAGQLTLESITQDYRCCVASLEFKPQKWLHRLTRQACGMAKPSEEYIRSAFAWYDQSLWVFDVVGTAKADRILDVFRYAARRYGITFFVVDNLAKCGFDEDDYNGQKKFIDKLTDFTKEFDAHVLLCLHMKKSEDERRKPGKMDVKGTGALTDMVDTVMVIWRNKPKEENRQKHEASQADVPLDKQEPFEDEDKPDGYLRIVKQRNGDCEPTAALWFHQESTQYLGFPRERAFRYVKEVI